MPLDNKTPEPKWNVDPDSGWWTCPTGFHPFKQTYDDVELVTVPAIYYMRGARHGSAVCLSDDHNGSE